MKKSGFIKFLKVLLVLALVGGGMFAWKIASPVLAVLKEKDPEKYETMLALATSFEFSKTMKNYTELDRMTYEEVLTVRYHSLNKKRQEDADFRESHWENEWELREGTRALKKEEHQNQLKELIRLSEKRRGSVLLMDWKKSGAWEKGLLLREKCIKYLEIEKKENQGTRKLHKLPRLAPLLRKPRETSLTVPEICEKWVPISHDEAQVVRALENLKNKMDYFFFVQLLDEIGVSRQDVFSFPAQLDRITGGFSRS